MSNTALYYIVIVKKKHAENVPHNLSESEFWTRFFQSHYFHRDRINFGHKEIFAECAKHDEQGKSVKVNCVKLLEFIRNSFKCEYFVATKQIQ